MTAKTVFTDKEPNINDPMLYIFENDTGDRINVEAHNYRQAKRALDKHTGNKKGYKLIERRL